MFNLFKKKEKVTLTKTEVDVKVSKASYPPEVQAIHNEFQGASEALIKQANDIIAEASTKDAQKVARLEKLGFKQVDQVTQTRPIIEKAELGKEQIELVKYYREHYPNNNFITEEQVGEICFKYNLICGDVGRYKGFVPEKNLREIEAFTLKENELNSVTVEVVHYSFSRKSPIRITIKNFEVVREGAYYFLKVKGSKHSSRAFQSNNGVDFYGNDSYNVFGFSYLNDIRFSLLENVMKICAPVKDMDLTGMTISQGYKMEKHIPDPVVLRKVRGGYLIITAWGDEANDELVVNKNTD